MESSLLQTLEGTQSSQEAPRKQAEQQLQNLYYDPAFPSALCNIAINSGVPLGIRQSALLALKSFILAGWSPSLDEFKGQVLIDDTSKTQVRHALLGLATDENVERKIQNAASYVVSKIASVDYPDEWPDLLPTLLQTMVHAGDNGLHGALKVLAELVEEGFNEDQFFKIAQDLVNMLHTVSLSEGKQLALRALAVYVYRGCFDILEMILEDHKSAVKSFAEQSVNTWMPFFLQTLQVKLPLQANDETTEDYRGLVTLKLQVVKTLMRIRMLFPSIILPQSQALFSATWDELRTLQQPYQKSYIESEREGRLEDSDGLPYTLDFLVLEDLDFMQLCVRAPPVRKILEAELKQPTTQGWMVDLLGLLSSYAQITQEEEGMWNIDVNVYLSEETSVTANYTSRTASGDFAVKLGEWLPDVTMQSLLAFTKNLFETGASWQTREAALFLLGQVLTDWQDIPRKINDDFAQLALEIIKYSMAQPEVFLRARGFLVAGTLANCSNDSFHHAMAPLLEATVQSTIRDSEDVVQVACIRAMSQYLQSLPKSLTQGMQASMVSTLSQWLSSQDHSDLVDSDDLVITLLVTLKDALLLDTRICIAGDGLNSLFNIASTGAANMQISSLVAEFFEEICITIKALGNEAYNQLIMKVLPSLTGAFNLGNITNEDALTSLAAHLLSHLTEHAHSPLPSSFVPAVLPKLIPLLLNSPDSDVLKNCTSSLNYTLQHTPDMLSWHDPTSGGPTSGKSGLECTLLVIDRLLSPAIDDDAAVRVGNLATTLVATAGNTEQLTPYLTQLLQAVAMRLSSAMSATLIQSLTLVFARLSLTSAREVLDFLTQVNISGVNGLHSLMPKWLDNTPDFAGFDDIRTNVVALARIYELRDARLEGVPCRGDLIVEQETSGRIMTRSRAKARPERWTEVPAPVKIIKVLVAELSAQMASGGNAGLGATGAVGDATFEADDEDDEDDDGEWEDEPGTSVLDLGLGMTKAELMGLGSLGGEEGSFSLRQADDETQAFLVDFFRRQAQNDGARFEQVYAQLSDGEREKLNGLG